jgi:hypothetical protein
MQLEDLYRVTFTNPESWKVTRPGGDGAEGQSFLIAEGRATGRLSARYRAANYPRRRADGALEPSFRGVLETDDGATVLFHWEGLAAMTPSACVRCSARSSTSRTTRDTPGSTTACVRSKARFARVPKATASTWSCGSP